MPLVSVLLPLKFDQLLTYRAQMGLPAGTLVEVPLGKKAVIGCVWDGETQSIDEARVKAVLQVLGEPPLQQALRDFIDWVAKFTLATRGQVLKLALREAELRHQPVPHKKLRFSAGTFGKQSPQRQRIIDLLQDGFARSRTDILAQCGVSAGVVDALRKLGALEEVTVPNAPLQPLQLEPHFGLSEAQEEAAAQLRDFVQNQVFQPVLLRGATGSGKTEVYFEAVREALSRGQQALVMVPEIALTGQFLSRFAQRFGAAPAVWHSQISLGKRAEAWRQIAAGAAKVVVGARSSLFLPFQQLGVIIVDEEHESAYRQEDHVLYHARDMAVARAKFERCPVVLASATPSLESWANARSNRYKRLELAERFGQKALPRIECVDLRGFKMKSGEWLTPPLREQLEATLEAGQQSLLFLNRRGYAPLTLCRACGHRVTCPQCAAYLVEHKHKNRLQCHHCGFSQALPKACPSCGKPDSFVSVGIGVERVAEDVKTLFPQARVLTLSSDQTGGLAQLHAQIEKIEKQQVDIIVGTQLVAKGHNFPGLTFVGVIDGDFSLGSGDPRAGERTFQVLNQVIGRAGRGTVAGHALVQTAAPEHPVLRALLKGDQEAFYSAEAAQRQSAGLPPTGRLAAVIVSDEDVSAAFSYARTLARIAPKQYGIRVLGPAEAPFARLKGRFRYRLLVKATRDADLQAYLRAWIKQAPVPKARLKCVVDVDPYTFL